MMGTRESPPLALSSIVSKNLMSDFMPDTEVLRSRAKESHKKRPHGARRRQHKYSVEKKTKEGNKRDDGEQQGSNENGTVGQRERGALEKEPFAPRAEDN